MKALFSSREGHFSLRWIRGILAIRRRGLCISSERYIGELGARCLSTLNNRGQDSRQQALVEAPRERACCYYGEGYGKGFAVGGSVGFRKGRYVHLYNCVVGAISRVDF